MEQLGAVTQTELEPDLLAMGLDGMDTHEKVLGDPTRRIALGRSAQTPVYEPRSCRALARPELSFSDPSLILFAVDFPGNDDSIDYRLGNRTAMHCPSGRRVRIKD